jgi:hypothetical protein
MPLASGAAVPANEAGIVVTVVGLALVVGWLALLHR